MRTLLLIIVLALSGCASRQYTDSQCQALRPLLESAWDLYRYNKHCEKYAIQGDRDWVSGTIKIRRNGKTSKIRYRIK